MFTAIHSQRRVIFTCVLVSALMIGVTSCGRKSKDEPSTSKSQVSQTTIQSKSVKENNIKIETPSVTYTAPSVLYEAEMNAKLLKTLEKPMAGIEEAIRIEKIKIIQQRADLYHKVLTDLSAQQSKMSVDMSLAIKKSRELSSQAEKMRQQSRIQPIMPKTHTVNQ